MQSSSTNNLNRRVDKMLLRVENEAQQAEIVIRCSWGHEQIPDDPDAIIIRTQWGRGPLEDDAL